MPTSRRNGRKKASSESGARSPLIVYVHGIGNHPPAGDIKLEWDLALFGRDMKKDTRMAYWADILHGAGPGSVKPKRVTSQARSGEVDLGAVLAKVGVDANNAKALDFASGLVATVGAPLGPGPSKRVLPLPGSWRRPLSRAFLETFVGDTAAYFFDSKARRAIRQRLADTLPSDGRKVILVSHSQGTIISFEVLSALADKASVNVVSYVTLGSPLGIQEIQDFLEPKLRVPDGVVAWKNFADPLDAVALDKDLANDFEPRDFIQDVLLRNERTGLRADFNPHSAAGYLAHPKVRTEVHRAAQLDSMRPFVVARDVAERLGSNVRQPVLIEVLEPNYSALDESAAETRERESEERKKTKRTEITLAERTKAIAAHLATLVPKAEYEAARIDELRRFVAAHLTPAEIRNVALEHRNLRVYAVWRSSTKRKLVDRSARVLQVDAARASYGAAGEDITWAVLDTGVRGDHPHFSAHKNITAVWDCTKRGRPQPIDIGKAKDRDGHGTHVSGIIAGEGHLGKRTIAGLAPRAKLVVYKVLNDKGEGEDAWIIKALDHVAEQNENNAAIAIHGVNLSLGGSFDSTVYGCGFSPICVELRRLWRQGVLVVVACGNEGQIEIQTSDGDFDLHTQISIGDPANLEDCIAVGSVNADHPHLYGVSSFSSRGPTADGRPKPDVVAPGERIRSCNAQFSGKKAALDDLYYQESGTSMAAPHVSGMLAAFLSVRREFRGRPDEVKRILLNACTDLGRDRYHQGHGLPNLMKMLLSV